MLSPEDVRLSNVAHLISKFTGNGELLRDHRHVHLYSIAELVYHH